jgi:hypothetical protein
MEEYQKKDVDFTCFYGFALRCMHGILVQCVMEKWNGIGHLASQPCLASHLNLAHIPLKHFLSTLHQTLLKTQTFHYLTNFIERIFRKKQVGAKHLFH